MTIHISFVLFEILGIHHSVIFPPNTSTEKKKKKDTIPVTAFL